MLTRLLNLAMAPMGLLASDKDGSTANRNNKMVMCHKLTTTVNCIIATLISTLALTIIPMMIMARQTNWSTERIPQLMAINISTAMVNNWNGYLFTVALLVLMNSIVFFTLFRYCKKAQAYPWCILIMLCQITSGGLLFASF